jgi:hypothetical protein
LSRSLTLLMFLILHTGAVGAMSRRRETSSDAHPSGGENTLRATRPVGFATEKRDFLTVAA